MAQGRLGLIGKKLGMTQVFAKGGELVPVTVIHAGPCTVVQKRTPGKDGYSAVQVGFGEKKTQRLTKAEREHRKKAGKMVSVLREFRDGGDLEVGSELKVGDLFKEGDLIDVTGVSKGKGYQGVVKRHHFSGSNATHGAHEYFRHGGSIGNRSYPGSVRKRMRMAGQLGNESATVLNLRVLEILPDDNAILISGAVPGADGTVVVVCHSAKERVRQAEPANG